MSKKYLNGVLVDMSSDEIQEYNERNTAWDNETVDRKLAEIKEIRLEKLQENVFYLKSKSDNREFASVLDLR